MSRRFLYRKSRVVVIILILAFMAAIAGSSTLGMAQGKPELKRPQDVPDEKPVEPKKKKVKGPRAVGILQMSSGGKTTLIPVAILIDGKFHDASVYKAEPVPMALEGGTVYEAERSGESEGLFTVNGALHSKNPGSAIPWIGTGSYLPHGANAPKTTRKAEDVPVGIDSSGDEPPRLTRSGTKASVSPSGSTNQSGTEPAGKGTTPASEKPGDSAAGGTGQNGGKSASPAAADEGVKDKAPAPTEQKSSDPETSNQKSPAGKSGEEKSGDTKSGEQGSAKQVSTTRTADNYYRPTLRRGKPTQAAPEEPEVAPKAGVASASAAVTPAGKNEVVQLVTAISDAGGPDPQSYKFFWKEGEEDERRKQMLSLAGDEVRAYVNARAKGAIPATASGAKTGVLSRRAPTAKPGLPEIENVQFRAFDVWKNNQPVMIFNAEARLASAPVTNARQETYSITLVARTDIYGNLRKLYSGVTDKFHLDVTPRLELVDVVDADGDGRGELLFRETGDGGSGYVIYRATGDKLYKMFDSLGGE